MEFIKALTFVTDDPRWKEKVAIGSVLALLSFLIVPVFILLGYSVRLIQNMRAGSALPLPDWEEWSGDLVRGFKLTVVYLVWSLPLLLVALPMAVGGILADSDSAIQVVGITLVVASSCLTLFYAILVTLATPGFVLWFARDERIRSGLQLSQIFGWTRGHLGDVILFMLAYVVASFVISAVAGIVGTLLCLVGLIVTVPLAVFLLYLYQFNLLGQLAYREEKGQAYYQPPLPPTL